MTGERRLAIEVPSGGPLFEGHFPGRPILPAVGLLHLAARALAAAGAPAALRGIASLRLRRPVAPGAALELRVGALSADGRARLEVRRATEVVAQAVLLLGETPAGSGAEPHAHLPRPPDLLPPPALLSPPAHLPRRAAVDGAGPRASRSPSDVPALDDLLPHRPPMRFVEGIERDTDDGAACAVRVPDRSAFDEDGAVPALVALEMAAQCAAASEALRRFRQGGRAGARVGYLVGARDVRFACARLPVGLPLLASVRLAGIALPLCTYDFEVAGRSGVMAAGVLSTWLTTTDA